MTVRKYIRIAMTLWLLLLVAFMLVNGNLPKIIQLVNPFVCCFVIIYNIISLRRDRRNDKE